MDKFNKTITILDNMISQLETNTGGEVPKQTESAPLPAPVQETTSAENEVKAEKPAKKEKQQKEAKVEQAGEEKKEKKKADKGEKKEKAEKTEKIEEKKEEKKDEEATVEDFAAIDIRIGEIVECWKHPESEKLYCEKINLCGEVREIASGLQQFVAQDDMKGLVIVMANLKPRPLAKFMSNGMVVCASNQDHTDVKIIRPQGAISERVFLEGHEELFKAEGILPVLNPKKKILEKCLEHFKTDAEGFITWKGIKAKTSGGFLKAEIVNGTVS